MDLSDITPTFVTERARKLENEWSQRNTRMDDNEDLTKLDVFEDTTTEAGAPKVASPRPFFTVEGFQSLLLTSRPKISVPTERHTRVSSQVAERIEKYLYGAWHEMRLLSVLDDAEWNACSLGQGVVRVVYDPRAPHGEYPILAQCIDPRDFYNTPSGRRPYEDSEQIHYLDRTRREIYNEWGKWWPEGAVDRTQPGAYEDFLDTEVDFIDYWRVVLVEEEVEPEAPERERPGLISTVRRILGEEEAEEAEERAERQPETQIVRKVINCVVADGQFVKEPEVMKGYERLPFFWWAGLKTPWEKEDSLLSVLYPISGGERPSGSQGMIATENMLLTLKMIILSKVANTPFVTNDDRLANLDTSPGAVNVADRGEDLFAEYLSPPGTHPDVDEVMNIVGQFADDATLPRQLRGRYVGDLSGVALSLLTNPALMRIAAKQRARETVWGRINEHVLALTEFWAPMTGWRVGGRTREGQTYVTSLPPAQIDGYRRNEVILSASLPKDTEGEAMVLANLVDRGLMSRETALNRLQEVTEWGQGRTVDEEMESILYESVIYGDPTIMKALGMKAMQEYDPRLAATVLKALQQQRQKPGPQPGPQTGRGPMRGVPPQGVPPEAAGGGGGPGPQPRTMRGER